MGGWQGSSKSVAPRTVTVDSATPPSTGEGEEAVGRAH